MACRRSDAWTNMRPQSPARRPRQKNNPWDLRMASIETVDVFAGDLVEPEEQLALVVL
jgi:hypothetical protein